MFIYPSLPPPQPPSLRNATPYEESYSSESSAQVMCEVQALSNFMAIEEGDLGFKDKEILVVLETRYS